MWTVRKNLYISCPNHSRVKVITEGFPCKSNDIMLKRRSGKIYAGFIYILVVTLRAVCRDSVVNILITSWMVRESNPGGGRYSAPIQTGLHSLQYNGYRDSLLGGKWQGCGIDHPPLCSAEVEKRKVKKRVEVYLYSPLGPHCLF